MVGIREFFAGKTVFLTGVTGLVGKLVLEKLLRCCEGVEGVYVLVRAKKGKDAGQRIKEICDSPVFDNLKKTQPDFQTKLHIIEGDLEHPQAFTVDQTILDTINIIIHCAATVRFNETLRRATFINVRGTKQMLDLARKIKQLEVFVYVSTAFSFCPHQEIGEKIYEVPIAPENLISNMEEIVDEGLLKDLEKSLVQKWPNTYSFTKAIAETLLLNYEDVPIAIVRPSILLGCAKEPLPGWIDNWLGISGVMLGIGLGVIRIFPINPKLITDLLPVDYAVSLILAAAWDVATTKNGVKKKEHVKIFNSVSQPDAPIYWSELKDYTLPVAAYLSPGSNAIWYPYCFFVPKKSIYMVGRIFLHYIPSYFFDLLAIINGRKERLSKIYKKIDEAGETLMYFTMNEWKFKNDNTKSLWKRMDPKERDVFYFDMEDMNWEKVLEDVGYGLRYYVEKDPKETVEAAKRKMFKLKIGNYIVVSFVFIMVLFFLYKVFLILF